MARYIDAELLEKHFKDVILNYESDNPNTFVTNKKKIALLAGTFRDVLTTIKDAPTVDAVPLPDNATNGDVILLIFEMLFKDPRNRFDTVASISKDHIINIEASDVWWDAPYKGEKNGRDS